jgi:hypothetical protein
MPDGDAYEMVVRLSSADLTVDLWRQYQPDESFFEDHSFIGPDKYIVDYINDNFKIRINSKLVESVLVSIEDSGEEKIVKMIVPVKGKIRSLDIDNRILTGLLPDQVNLFIYKDNSVERSYKLTADDYYRSIVESK